MGRGKVKILLKKRKKKLPKEYQEAPKVKSGFFKIPSTPDEFIIPRKKKGTVKFYDLAHLLGEDDIHRDLERFLFKPITFDTSFGQNAPDVDPLLSADFTASTAFILGQDDVFSRARQVDEESNEALYDMYVSVDGGNFERLGDDDNFTDDGWKIGSEITNATELNIISSHGLCEELKLVGPNKLKSTATFNYSADEANYKLTGGDSIYFLPRIFLGFYQCIVSRTNGASYKEEKFGYFYTYFPRDFYLTPTDPHYGARMGSWSTSLPNNPGWEQISKAILWGREVCAVEGRAWKFVVNEFGTWIQSSITPTMFPDPDNFSLHPSQPVANVEFKPFHFSSVFGFQSFLAGSLVAVVKRGGSTFYLWKAV